MPPKKWDEEESDEEEPVITRGVGVSIGGKKWDDEEEDEVPESWDAAEDSEEEAAKAAKAAAAKKAAEEAAANKKSRTERIAEKQTATAIKKAQEIAAKAAEADETPEEARRRVQQKEIESDLQHAEGLFGGATLRDTNDSSKASSSRGGASPSPAPSQPVDDVKRKAIALADPRDPSQTIDLSLLPAFNPKTKQDFTDLQNILAPLLTANKTKPHYPLFVQELARLLVKDMRSEQIRAVASLCTAAMNEKLREEKAGDRKKVNTKAAKKSTLAGAVNKGSEGIDTNSYDDFGDDDFM